MISIFGDKKRQDSGMPANEQFSTELSVAAKEAYKRLRTNLAFALPDLDEDGGYIVGITSALRGEGKSTTVLNLARALAEQGKRVIVVESNFRLPSLHKKLKIRPKQGLSNVLLTNEDPDNYIWTFKVGKADQSENFFHLLPVGVIPPNPSELLSSRQMEGLVRYLARKYEYVLLDLPPVTAVPDVLAATKLMDGVVMVVRDRYSDTDSMTEALRQLRQAEVKILGVVLTCANDIR